MRIGAAFLTLCAILIAGSLGVIAHVVFGFSLPEAVVTGIALFVGLTTLRILAARQREESGIAEQVMTLSRSALHSERQLLELTRRISALENTVANVEEDARAEIEPIQGELQVLGTLVKQLAESIAAHENALLGTMAATARRGSPFRGPEPRPPSEPLRAVEPAPPAPAYPSAATGQAAQVPPTAPFPSAAPVMSPNTAPSAEEIAAIRDAIESNRLDLHLQPILTLPQRKVRYYEALTRLRSGDGEPILPAAFLPIAAEAGVLPALDNLVLFRCVQIVRRFISKNRDVGVFCNVSGATLADPAAWSPFIEFLRANRAIASSLVLEFRQDEVSRMGPLEQEGLAAVAELGFRFSLDHVSDLRLEPRQLSDAGFRFIKVGAGVLLQRTSVQADIHPADFSNLLGRFGISLVAEKIESEGTVVDLLDHDVKFGQGFLFAPPRPIRAEALGGTAALPNSGLGNPTAKPRSAALSSPAAAGSRHGAAPGPADGGARGKAVDGPGTAEPYGTDARASVLMKLARDAARRG